MNLAYEFDCKEFSSRVKYMGKKMRGPKSGE
jgi:hypothetical protein